MTIISPQLGLSPTATTGGETYDREFLKQCVQLKQKVKILLPRGKVIPQELEQADVQRTPFGHFIPPYTFNLFALPWAIRKLQVIHDKLQVLRIHSPEYLFPTALIAKKLFPRIPLVVHYHLDQTGKLWTATNRILLNMADVVIADSEYLKKCLIDRVGIKEEKIKVVHCGVDIDAIKPKSYKESDVKTLLFLGRFIERKRPDFVLRVFSKLYEKRRNVRLLMVGEGPMERQLKLRVANCGLQHVIEFPGPLFGKEKLKKYHEADLFIFPSEKEGFVLVVLEAMAAGLPLLVPRALGFPEAVIEGKNGLLAESGNVEDWVAKVEKIFFSKNVAKNMGVASREIAVSKFSWKRCALNVLRAYEYAKIRI